jgi:hypothetical protein
MPVQATNTLHSQQIDQAQGWTTQFLNTYNIQLLGGHRFFTVASDTDENVVIGSIDTWTYVN